MEKGCSQCDQSSERRRLKKKKKRQMNEKGPFSYGQQFNSVGMAKSQRFSSRIRMESNIKEIHNHQIQNYRKENNYYN